MNQGHRRGWRLIGAYTLGGRLDQGRATGERGTKAIPAKSGRPTWLCLRRCSQVLAIDN